MTMAAGTVIEVRSEGIRERRIEVFQEGEVEHRYRLLVELVLRVGSWLTGPEARLLPPAEWEAHFLRYQDRLEDLRRLGDQLRPCSLRERELALTGDALVEEVAELFAA
jgi:hypothetical protein